MPGLVRVICLLILCVLCTTYVSAQTVISTINTSTSSATSATVNTTSPSDAGNSILDNTSYDILYGQGNDIAISSYVVSGTTYDRFLRPDTLVLNRRIASDRLVNIWYTLQSINTVADPDQLLLDPTATTDADAIYLTGTLNAGYDNILVNDDDLASGSIQVETERVDVIWYSGIQTSLPGTAVFPVIERGGNDNIAIAAITSLNPDGTPAGYGTLIGIPETLWPGTGQSFDDYLILRRETAGVEPIPLLNIGVIQAQGAQIIQGVAVSFTELGISANQSIFGYSLFSADVCSGFVTDTGDVLSTGAQTLAGGIDLTDITTFPSNTLSGDSGLDLVAGVSAAVASDDNLIETKGPGGYKSSLATWLKANEGITTSTDGSNVTLWEDQWLGNNDAQTSGVAAEPNPVYRNTTSAINFNPTVDFGSVTGSALRIPDSGDFNITNAPWDRKSFNIAIRTGADVSAKQVVYEQGGDTRGFNVYINGGSLFYSGWNLGGADGFGDPWGYSFQNATVTADTEYIITFEYDGDDDVTDDLSGEIRCFLNGNQIGTISGVGLLYDHADDIGLGDEVTNALYDNGAGGSETVQPTASFDGEISEFIYCNEPSAFALSQRRRIESYLAIKYGITLDQTSPIDYLNSDGITIFDATNNAAIGGYLEYNNDIAGIGRDDAAELDQPASRSENTGSIVTVDKGESLYNDDTWLIWGNDGAAMTETALLTMPDTIESRVNRVWRAAERNEAGNTTVSFDITGLGLSTDQNDFSLLIAGNGTNADFSSATVISGGTLVGNTLTFTGVDLDDGQYFTLGTDYFQCSPGGVETNLALWLKADDGTGTSVDGTNITTWTDKSGDGNNATASSGNEPNYAENSINFNPTVNFDEVNTEEITGTAGFHSVAYYMVVNPDNNFTSATDEDVLIGFGAPAGATDEFGALGLGSITGAFTGEVITHAIGGTGTRWRRGISGSTISQVNAGQTYMFGIRDNSGATSSDMFVNGLEQADLNSGTFLTSVDQDYEVGSYTSANAFATANHFDGQVGEVISYSVRPTDTEHSRIQSYLAVKYGITLDQTSATNYLAADGGTVWNATDNTGFANDIAGIGRDDMSCLNQKQSHSQNSGAIVTMGLGEIAASNNANANSFTTDDSFLIWGNDGASATEANSLAYTEGVVTERMLRIWRADENAGTVGNTDISFDLTGLGYTGSLSDYSLIISDASGLTSPTIIPASSFSSDVVTFSNIDLTDGQYFTLGTARTNCGPAGITASLAMWLRADAGTNTTVDAAAITAWSDQSGNNNNYAQLTVSEQPAFTSVSANFNPTITFDGGDVLDGNDNTYNDAIAFFTINGQSNGTFGHLLDNASYSLRYDQFSNTGFLGYTEYGVADNTSSVSTPFGNPSIISFEKASASSSYSISELSNGTRSTASLSVGTTTAPIPIRDLGESILGSIPEVIVYSSTLGSTDEAKIETYLAIKYGIQKEGTDDVGTGSVDERDYISAGDAIIWDYSANTTYNNDMAGIGRDDDGCFTQKQSASENSDDILTVGLGSVAASNSTNVNGFDDNGDYFVWGNDNGATAQGSANIVDVPGNVSERMTRIWKAQDTGTVGETELQFDLTGLGYSVADAAAFSLLVGNTATMADASIISGGTLNGNILSFTGIDLTDGQFFTIGTAFETCGPGGVNTNIALWLRADLEVFSDGGSTPATNGGNVEQWNDQSSPADNGSESNLLGSSPVEPTYETEEINFNPALRFVDPNSNNASYIETTSNTVSGDMTLISVFKTGQAAGTANDFENSPALIGASETGSLLDYGMGMENGTIWVNANATDATFDAETTTTFNNSTPHIALATRTQGSGAITIYVDSNSEATGTGSTSALTGPTSFGVGNHSAGDTDAQYGGDIAETLVFSRVLTSEERNRVDSYLALKYGITLDGSDDGTTGGVDERDYRAADGGAVWDFDGQGATYYNDIFGIGRDDLSCFEQTQSMSENSDAIVTLNQPGGSFSTDDSFLVSGNDNATIQGSTTELPAGINSRLVREWKVQETGTVGTVEVTYDLSSIDGPTGLGTSNLSLIRLMVDDDSDFTSGATLISPSSIDGTNNTVTFTVDFTDGQYYTLGSSEVAALPITLISFTASPTDFGNVSVEWATASEENNAYFTIERSTDAIEFEAIGTREGAGTSEGINYYKFTDIRPVNGLSYYRLKQTDFNGEFEYSELQRVFLDLPEVDAQFKLYPNPISSGESVKLAYRLDNSQEISIHLISANGTQEGTVKATLDPSERYLEIPVQSLSKGLHFIRIRTTSGQTTTLKLLVQ